MVSAGLLFRKATVFWDSTCLREGEPVDLDNTLRGSSLVMPFVSAETLKAVVSKASKACDDLLLEWRAALDYESWEKCTVLPIFVEVEEHRPGPSGDLVCNPAGLRRIAEECLDKLRDESDAPLRETIAALFDDHDRPSITITLRRSFDGKGVLFSGPDVAEDQLQEAVCKIREILGSEGLRLQRSTIQKEYDDEKYHGSQPWNRVEAIILNNDRVGEGASSIIYRGTLDSREVAIKALKPHAPRISDSDLNIMKKELDKVRRYIYYLRKRYTYFPRGVFFVFDFF